MGFNRNFTAYLTTSIKEFKIPFFLLNSMLKINKINIQSKIACSLVVNLNSPSNIIYINYITDFISYHLHIKITIAISKSEKYLLYNNTMNY